MAHQQGYMHLIGTYPNSAMRSSSNKLSMFVNNATLTMVQLKMHDPNSTKAWTGSLSKNIMQLAGERKEGNWECGGCEYVVCTMSPAKVY